MIYFFPTVILLIIAWLIKYKKITWLISGYNTASKEAKKEYDIEKLTRHTGNFLFILAVIFLVMAVISILISEYIAVVSWVGFGVLFISIFCGIIYLNTKNRVKKKVIKPVTFTLAIMSSKKKKIILNIVISLAVSIIIYFGIASIMIATGRPDMSTADQTNLDFKQLYLDYSSLPELQSFNARDGKELDYRYYPAESNNTLILIHGSGWHSQYFLPLAEFISSENLAQVYTPDLRGHGQNPDRRGDVDYIEQLDDDLADFIALIKEKNPEAFIVLGGHSSGGGLVIRFAGSKYIDLVDAYLLLTPYLKYNAPTIQPNSGGWAVPYIGRIAGLTMLNNVGIHWFDYLTVIEFNMPKEARNGTETLSYTFRMNTAYAPRNYKKDLGAIYQPILVVAGKDDESNYADQFGPVISQYTESEVELLEGVTHMGVVIGKEIQPVVKKWLESLN